jgi:hypothetical protein
MILSEGGYMKFKQMKIVNSKTNKEYGMFWLDEEGNVDEYNLPNDSEFAALLKVMMHQDISIEETGDVVDDEL